jgi:hypothetical protein
MHFGQVASVSEDLQQPSYISVQNCGERVMKCYIGGGKVTGRT